MSTVKRFGAALASGKEHAPGRDYDYHKKTMKTGQNKYGIVSDIVQIWCHWIKDREGKPKPIFCFGPDPASPLYMNDAGVHTGQPVCIVCQANARMALSKDDAVVKVAEEMLAKPAYCANVVDLDDLDWHEKNQHTKLLTHNDDTNFFGQGMANDIYQALVNYGSADDPADYRTWNSTGLCWVTTKKGEGKGTRYPTSGIPAPAGLMQKALTYKSYDLTGEIAAQTPVQKMEEWLGKGFFAQYGVTVPQIEEAKKWIKEGERRREADEAVTAPGSNAPTAPPPVARPAAPPTEPAAPQAPASPQEPAAPPPPPPPPPPPVDQVVGPDGAMLPSGVRWQKTAEGKAFYWHTSNPKKTAWTPVEVSVPQ